MNEVSILQFTPGAGDPSTQVTIYGTGFLDTPSANTVKFNGVTATVTAATRIQLSVTVPAGAGTGPINVTNANGATTSGANFYIPTSGVEFPISIAFGESVPFLFATPPTGQNLTKVALMFFSGSAGQRASVVVEDLLCGLNSNPPPYAYAQISIVSPSSAVIASVPFQNVTFPGQPAPTPFAFIESLPLPLTGQYTIVIDPIDTFPTTLCGGFIRSFGATARLYDVPPDIAAAIPSSGRPFPLNFLAPSQNAVLTFDGLNGQRICLQGSQEVSTSIGTNVKVFSPGTYPAGTPLISQVLTSSFFVEPIQLTANGTYTILVDPQLNKTRSATLTLYDVPPDLSGSLSIGAQPLTVTIPSVGQAALLSFSVPASQSVTVHVTGNFVGGDNSTAVSLLRSDNTVVTSTTSASIAFDLSPQTLTAGTYRVKIDPQTTNRGQVSVNLTTP